MSVVLMCTDEDMTPEHFARQTCLDCDVPVAFEAQVSSTLRWHIARARAIASCPEAHNKVVTVHVCHLQHAIIATSKSSKSHKNSNNNSDLA